MLDQKNASYKDALIDNEYVSYDTCSLEPLNDDGYEYLGEGIIFAINGVRHKCKHKKYYFYRRL